MALGLAQATVTWQRTDDVQGAAPGDLGAPTTTPAPGYPRTVTGVVDWKRSSPGSGKVGTTHGTDQRADGLLLSDTYFDGITGDTFTMGGVQYRVLDANVHTNPLTGENEQAEYIFARGGTSKEEA